MTSADHTRPELPEALVDLAAERLLAVTGPERERVLAALLAEHPEHASSLRQLRADLGGAEGLLDTTYPDHDGRHGKDIGGHRILRQLGEGAFGLVFLCAQETPVVRQVAIKVLRPGAGDQKTLRRFGAERQLLAALNHPTITQVFDAGELPDGRPFFVMEYVDGAPIRSYCEVRNLTCPDRLRLFVELCRGVAHAHKRGIVHRDLKPANVLVVDTDQGPMPKIIDFGIAKALFPSGDTTGPRTDAGRVIGTPGYMSPEQAAGRTDEIDERADVFALGVMLYELLTGELPWARGASATDTEPVRPSARITTSTGAAAQPLPPQRRQLAAELRGDLDWITLKALARERNERYPAVTDLLADIERHLRGEVVSVGPPSIRYRLRKFVRRHRVVVAAVGLAVGIVSIGLGVSLAYGQAASAEVHEARQAADASSEDATALVELLLARAKDPRLLELPQGDATRQDLLRDALAGFDRIKQGRPTDPRLRRGRCQALLGIAEVQILLGEPTRSAEVAAAAVAEAQGLFAAEPDSLANRGLLGEALRKEGRAFSLAGNKAASLPKLTAATGHLAACAAADPVGYGRSYSAVLREAAEDHGNQQLAQSLATMRESLQVLDGLRRDHPQIDGLTDDHVQACVALASKLIAARNFDEAQRCLATAAVEVPLVTHERGRLETLVHQFQGQCAWFLGDRPKAIEFMKAAVAAADTWAAAQPQRVLPQDFLTRVLRDLGQFENYVSAFDESSLAYRRAIVLSEAMVQRFPEDPTRLAGLCRQLRQYSQVLWDRFRRGDLEEAEACAIRAIAVNDRIAPSVDLGRQPRWMLLATQAGIMDSSGKDASAVWQAVEAELPSDPSTCEQQHQGLLGLVCLELAQWHFKREEFEATLHHLTWTHQAIERDKPASDKLLVEVGWLEARLAAARGDLAAVAAAADRIMAARGTWFAARRAADCLALAWRLAGGSPAADPEPRTGYRDRAAKLYGDVMDTLRGDVTSEPLDPWYVVHWGFSCVRAAELAAAAGETKQALDLLHAALPKLERVRATAPADQWEEPIMQDGRALLARLAPSAGPGATQPDGH